MNLTGLHLLLTLKCPLECDHCFVWSSPRQTATMTLADVRHILRDAILPGGIEWIHFEGGEPFLFPDLLLNGVREVARHGLKAGIVTNCFWADNAQAALNTLRPFAGMLDRLSISCDPMHWNGQYLRRAQAAIAAAQELDIAVSQLRVVKPPTARGAAGLPPAEPSIMYRGRAAVRLANWAIRQPLAQFAACPHENLRSPSRVHVDSYGNLLVCQGLSIGNLFHASLVEICDGYDADKHPIVGPLVRGGPAELARRYAPHDGSYVDACHACYEVRRTLRMVFPEVLAPHEMYGVYPA